MDATPRPTPFPVLLEPEDVAHHRHLLCPRYDDCLTVAIRERWLSWSCGECPRASVDGFRIEAWTHEGDQAVA